MMMTRILALLSLAVILTSSFAYGQEGPEHLDPWPHGAGRTYSVTGRGFEGALLNPAVLALGADRSFEFSVFPITGFGAKIGPSFSDINTITNGDASVDSNRQKMIDLLFNNKLSGSANGRVFGISFSRPDFGAISFNWTTYAGVKTILGDSLLRYFGQNVLSNLSRTLQPASTDVSAQWYSEYTLSYGRRILGGYSVGDFELDGGVGVKLVSGIASVTLDPKSSISIDPVGGSNLLTVHYKLQYAYPDGLATTQLPSAFSLGLLTTASAGTGFGADVGIVLGPHTDPDQDAPYRLAFSITDIGSISWTKHTDLRTLDTTILIDYSREPSDSLRAQFNALEGHLDTSGHPFTTSLPTTLHMAAQVSLAGLGIAPAGLQFSAAGEFAIGLTDAVSAPTKGRFGFAAILQRPSPTFSFRTALGFVTEQGSTDLTLGLGIGISERVMVDFGTAGLTGLFKSDSPTDAALSVRVLL